MGIVPGFAKIESPTIILPKLKPNTAKMGDRTRELTEKPIPKKFNFEKLEEDTD
jgi:hypothetical protein